MRLHHAFWPWWHFFTVKKKIAVSANEQWQNLNFYINKSCCNKIIYFVSFAFFFKWPLWYADYQALIPQLSSKYFCLQGSSWMKAGWAMTMRYSPYYTISMFETFMSAKYILVFCIHVMHSYSLFLNCSGVVERDSTTANVCHSTTLWKKKSVSNTFYSANLVSNANFHWGVFNIECKYCG